MSNQNPHTAQSCILPHMERTWMTFGDARAALGVSRRRVYQLAAAGELDRWYNAETGKLGFARQDVDAYLSRPPSAARIDRLPRDASGRFVSATR